MHCIAYVCMNALVIWGKPFIIYVTLLAKGFVNDYTYISYIYTKLLFKPNEIHILYYCSKLQKIHIVIKKYQ